MSRRAGHSTPPAPAKSAADASRAGREIEWQLAAPDLEAVRQWLGRHCALDGLRIERLPAQQLHDTYLDTEDWRLFRAGYALRLREREGHAEATLKGLRSARDDVADRPELTESLAEGKVRALARATGRVGSRVRDVIGVMPLRRLFEVRTARERFAVRRREPAEDVGEIALDEAHFSRGNGHRRPVTLTRVELEAAGPDCAPLEQIAARLRTECGLQPATQNKFAAGLHSASLEPPWPEEPDRKAEPARVAMSASSRTGDFAAAALLRLLEEWRAHEPAARLGERPEALHALRVTGRRMDTVLSLFRDYLPAALARSRSKLKSLVDALGGVRDVDIRLETINAFRSELAGDDRQALEPLLHHLDAEKSKARKAMLRALDAAATRHWFERVPAWLALPSPRTASGPRGDATALRVVPDLIHKRYRKLHKCARRLTARSSMAEYHKVRVRTKKMRYALEIVAPTYAQPADEMLAALHKLQSRLGTQHDSDVLAAYLTRLATRPPADFDARTAFLMGRMAEQHARRAARTGGKVEKPLRKVCGKRWKALSARMRALRDEPTEVNSDSTDGDGAGRPTGDSGNSAAGSRAP